MRLDGAVLPSWRWSPRQFYNGLGIGLVTTLPCHSMRIPSTPRVFASCTGASFLHERLWANLKPNTCSNLRAF